MAREQIMCRWEKDWLNWVPIVGPLYAIRNFAYVLRSNNSNCEGKEAENNKDSPFLDHSREGMNALIGNGAKLGWMAYQTVSSLATYVAISKGIDSILN